MLSLFLAAVISAQAAPTPAKPSGEQQARAALAAAGMSQAGIESLVAIDKKHSPTLREVIVRGRQAEIAVRAALAKRPVDVDGYAAANTARADAAASFQRETASIAIEQLRALSSADQAILASKMNEARPVRPGAARAPAKR